MNLPEIREMKGSARNQIYENMKQWIIEGTLKPGEKISDFDIASHFHVSRTPVREAFQQLEMQKLIRSYPGKATFVTEMETENIGQWYLPMISLQQLAASMAVEKVTEEQILQLKEKGEVFSRLVESRGEPMELLQADRDFHEYILEIAGNDYIIDFCNTLWTHILRLEYRFFKETATLEESVWDHQELIKDLEIRDSFTISMITKRHWERTAMEIEFINRLG
ncbi:GntR family transcriptional regulator [Blautia sp. An249]|uniref:GntR family transcriptional regulator n=1 Tax=Blautia sp. An249 TaxID=1965603 RepID=UPI000B367703|nr:GntR family transcriptional regulator [Blautia sp. An249]OUO79115.1 GntR family transcriptional regulator [Blautia sp. An249]